MACWSRSRFLLLAALLVGTSQLAAQSPCAVAETADSCTTGRSQSPIVLNVATSQSGTLKSPALFYQPTGVVLLNDKGKTLQVQYSASSGSLGPGDNRVQLDGIFYHLVEFHFHWPGEHPFVQGGTTAPFPMELHLVHQDQRGARLAVVAVPIEVKEGIRYTHAAFGSLLRHLPPEKDDRRFLPGLFDADNLLPKDRQALRYPGSLTTGACEETVRWSVYTSPITISQEQFDQYKKVFKLPHTRDAQNANGRVPILTRP